MSDHPPTAATAGGAQPHAHSEDEEPHSHHGHHHSHHHHHQHNHVPAPPQSYVSNMPPPPQNTFLTALITRTLRVGVRDGRVFVGQLKCTDRDMNLILAQTTEYRFVGSSSGALSDSPTTTITTSSTDGAKTTTTTTTTTTIVSTETSSETEGTAETTTVIAADPAHTQQPNAIQPHQGQKFNVRERFMGLVVIPGELVVRVELEGEAPIPCRGQVAGQFRDERERDRDLHEMGII